MSMPEPTEAPRLSSLSFVFPMYNEIGNIEETVRQAAEVGPQLAEQHEIVVVNDASTDGCDRLAESLRERYPQLRVVHHERNQGLGGTLRTGFAEARNDWVLYIDSDLPVRLSDAVRVLPRAREADAVIGYRSNAAESFRRAVLTKGYNNVIRLLFGLKVKHVNFPFKLFHRELLQRMDLRSRGSFIDAELLLEARRAGGRIAEVPMEYQARVAGVSTLASPRVIRGIVREMLIYRRRPRDGRGGSSNARAESRSSPASRDASSPP